MSCSQAILDPVAPGAKDTLAVQAAPGARVAGLIGQLFVCLKPPALAPTKPMLEKVSGAGPALVMVTG